jgi:hypothetical protein
MNTLNQIGVELDGSTSSSVHESSSSSSSTSDEVNATKDDSTSELGTSHHNNNNDDENKALNETIRYAATENKLVIRWRRIVIISILLVGVLVGSITYITLHKAQTNDSTNAVRIFFHFFIPFSNTEYILI